MVRFSMVRVALVLGGAVALASVMQGSAAATYQVCETVAVDQPPVTDPLVACFPSPWGPTCVTQGVVNPTVTVIVNVCVPSPMSDSGV
jgi:hypothetical protein